MVGIHKMSPLCLGTPKAFERFLRKLFWWSNFDIFPTLNSQFVIWPKERLHRYFLEKNLKMDGCGQLLLNSPSKDFQENILSGVILVYNRYSKEPFVIWPEKRLYYWCFNREILEDGWLWTATSEQSKQKISKKTFLARTF